MSPKKKQEDTGGSTRKFEELFEELQRITTRLERGDVGLEEAIELFEEGMKLAAQCRAKLDEAEKRIMKLTRDNTLEEFDPTPLGVE